MARTQQQRQEDAELIALVARLMTQTFSSAGNYAIEKRAMERMITEYSTRILRRTIEEGRDPREVLQRWVENAPRFNSRLVDSQLNESVRVGFGPQTTLLTEAAVQRTIAAMCPPENDY